MRKSRILLLLPGALLLCLLVIALHERNKPFQTIHDENDFLSDVRTQENPTTLNGAKNQASEAACEESPANTPEPKKLSSESSQHGFIGDISDSPMDNVFHISLADTIPQHGEAWLEYELYGVSDFTGVTKGVNDHISIGGLVVKRNASWSQQKEQLPLSALRPGLNTIRFSKDENNDLVYQVKNVRLHILGQHEQERRLVVNQPLASYFFEGYGYVQGFVEGAGSDKAILRINGDKVQARQGVFEAMARANELDENEGFTAQISAHFEDGQVLTTSVYFSKTDIADYLNIPGQTRYKQFSSTFLSTDSIQLCMDDFYIAGAPNSLAKPVEISVTTLRNMDMPTTGASMVNVTGGAGGYRMLPHGSKFAKALQMAIPYDKEKIPAGYRPSDIRSFYFDEQHKRWIELAYGGVDEENELVFAYTDHFTDFINGVIKVPEAPQTNAYTPTSMKELQAANPLDGVHIIQPPSANNMGTANMSLPIVVPAGRNGLQPNLAITYNSDGGNGWLGMGWNLSLPSIDVDNRWGVPRFIDTLESESYLVNGEQLLPMVQRAELAPRVNGPKAFDLRIEGRFDNIQRFGDAPDEYWWLVTDRNGVEYYYGKYSTDAQVNPTCVLADDAGNIAHWALAEVRDLRGNFIRYTYQVVSTSINGISNGRAIYPNSINYTGHGTTDGKYSVHFELENTVARPDIIISGRNGFREVTAHRLRKVMVKYNNQFIRDYWFDYKLGAFDKSLLCVVLEVQDLSAYSTTSIDTVLLGRMCSYLVDAWHFSDLLTAHKFDYHDDQTVDFHSPEIINPIDEDGEAVNFLDQLFSYGNSRNLGRSVSHGHSFGGGINFGIGPKYISKEKTFGGNFSRSYDFSHSDFIFMDIDGDGLGDKVFIDQGVVKYRPLKHNGSTVVFDNNAIIIPGLSAIGKSQGSSWNTGLEIQFVGLSASVGWSDSESKTTQYFVDLNGDGLLDYVDEGKIYINTLINGVPNFIQNTGTEFQVGDDVCNIVYRDVKVDPGVYQPYRESGTEVIRNAVRMWRAPFDGKVKIDAPLSLIEDNSPSRAVAYLVDGVSFYIQHNSSIITQGSVDQSTYTPYPLQQTLSISKGDILYFRLYSNSDKSFDHVEWDPLIYYVDPITEVPDTALYDAERIKTKVFRPSRDFVLNDNRKVQASASGNVAIIGTISGPALSDDVTFTLKHNSTTIWTQSITSSNTFQLNLNESINGVSEGDDIVILAECKTNIDWSKIENDVEMVYTSLTSPNFPVNPSIPAYSITTDLPLSFNFHQFTIAPTQYFVANTTGTYTFEPVLSGANPNLSDNVVLSIKKPKKKLAELTIPISNGSHSSLTISTQVNQGDTIFLDFFSNNHDLVSNITSPIVKVNNVNRDAAMHATMPVENWKFGNLVKGWGQFSYYSSTPGIVAINTSLLDYPSVVTAMLSSGALPNTPTLPTNPTFSDLQTALSFPGSPGSPGGNNPLTHPFAAMYANKETNSFSDYTYDCHVGASEMRNTTPASSFNETIFDFPIPFGLGGQLETTVLKESFVENKSSSIGIGPLSYSKNSGTSVGTLDFMDLNGDRYPDVIGLSKVQWTKPNGAFEATGEVVGFTDFQISSFDGEGASLGVNLPQTENEKAGKMNTRANLGVSFGSDNYGEIQLIDVNGDGLPDRVDKTNSNVRLNFGYYFGVAENWGTSNFQIGESNASSLSISGVPNEWEKDHYSMSVGVNLSANDNKLTTQFADMNGDGLIDLIFIDNQGLSVELNHGTAFGTSLGTGYIGEINQSNTVNAGISGAGTIGGPLSIATKMVFTPQIGINSSLSFEKIRMHDINNDGYLDIIVADGNDYKVYYSKLKEVNRLRKVNTSIGSTYEIKYVLSEGSQDNPNRQWLFDSLTVYDGHTGNGADISKWTYEYANPKYHRFERTSLGFETVTTIQLDTENGGVAYRYTEERFHTDKFLFKGLKNYESVRNENGNLFLETFYTYETKDIASGNVVTSPFCTDPVYPAISAIDRFYFEGQSNYQIHTREEFEHGPYGNVIIYRNLNDMAINDDDVHVDITYNAPVLGLNLLSLANSVVVSDYSTNTLRMRTADYDLNTGELTTVRHHDLSTNITAGTTITYNGYGLIDELIMPEDENQEHLIYEYTYDNVVNQFPIVVQDNLDYTSSTEYDYRIQKPILTTDIAGQEMEFVYYPDGRLQSVAGPNEIAQQIPWLIYHEYGKDNTVPGRLLRWAKTTHYDPINTSNSMVSVVFTDGLGRVVQTKRKGTVDGVDELVVSGPVIYDAFGRSIESYHPFTEAISGNNDVNYSQNTPQYATTTVYDILDRPTSIKMPNSDMTSIAYGFGTDDFGDTRFLTEITDANNITTHKYTDHRQLQTTIEAANNTVTKFVYDPLGQLTSSTDPIGNSTEYQYSMLGQLVERIHPDAGSTRLVYGPSGNLLSKETQILQNLSLAIHYTYDHGRPTHIAYPQHPENDVTYHYSPHNSGNETGRITHIQDASGLQELKYGPLGELIENTRTFVHPGNGVRYTFRTQWEYDSWNRTRSITYADGEVVQYGYDNGGMLRQMSGTKGNDQYPYVDEIHYDHFGSRTHIAYGNGSYTNYVYEPDMRRLSRLETWDAGQNLMQDLTYSYDAANNITELSNSASDVSGMGGQYSYQFTYDDLYRLSTAKGLFDNNNYYLAMQYSPNGQISSKELMADFNIAGNQYSKQYQNVYNYTTGLNAPQEVIDQFSNNTMYLKWDANGNLAHYGESESGLTRSLCWDEENRLTTVKDGDYMSTYLYDHTGERVWKMTGEVQSMSINGQYYIDYVALDRKTLYTNPYLIVTEAEYTKHYYAESQRIASKLGGGWANALVDPLNDHLTETVGYDFAALNEWLVAGINYNSECVGMESGNVYYIDGFTAIDDQYGVSDPEVNQYFYHPDHLGSSSFITNASGDVDQHLQYLPFGEPWIDQRTSNNIRFTFSGKERDEETGYNYFGARYYNADISIWLSVDPLSDQASGWTPYRYGFNNPLKFTDPTGLIETNDEEMSHYHLNEVTVTSGRELRPPIPFLNSDDSYQTVQNSPNSIQPSFSQFSELRQAENKERGEITSGMGPALIGGGMATTSHLYNPKTGSWVGKNFKVYSSSWGGNKITGGKNKFSGRVSASFTVGGFGLGVYNAYNINDLHNSGMINDFQMEIEQASNVITTLGGIHGAAWGFGWELGREITKIPGYHENVRLPIQRYLGLKPSEPKCQVCPYLNK